MQEETPLRGSMASASAAPNKKQAIRERIWDPFTDEKIEAIPALKERRR